MLTLSLVTTFIIIEGVLSQCSPRDYGGGSVVCVCNTSYCDTFGRIPQVDSDVALVYVTSKDGDRFKSSRIPFERSFYGKEGANHIAVDRSNVYQTILGFGGAFTDSATMNIALLPEALQDEVIKGYYSEEGLDFTLGRIPMGTSDFSVRGYSYDDVEGDFELAHFQLAEEDIKYKIPFLQKAKSLTSRELLLYGSPWSPPAWMKDSKRFTGQGSMIGSPGEKYYKTWANYFVKFLDAYKSHNISLWGLTVENEPQNVSSSSGLPNLCMTPEQQRDFVKKDLGPALAQAGYGPDKIKLMVWDFNRLYMYAYVKTVLEDPETSRYVSGIGHHWYTDYAYPPDVLDNLHEEFPDKFLLLTEACDGNDDHKTILGRWKGAEDHAHLILQNLQHWSTGWVEWNLALDEQGGPNWVKNFVDAPVIVNAKDKEFYRQPTYYSFSHFSKFVPRGSKRIGIEIEKPDELEAIAFTTPIGSTVVVVLNSNDQPEDIVIVDPIQGSLTATIKAHSFQTFVWWPKTKHVDL